MSDPPPSSPIAAPPAPVAWLGASPPPGLDALLALARREGIDWLEGLPEAWAERPFVDEGEGLFVMWVGDQLGAVAAITADPYVDDRRTGRLRYIYVRRDLRGRGMADALLRACLARSGTRWSRLRLHTDNPAAARLYARHGFEPVEEARATHAMTVGPARGRYPGG